MKKKATNHLKQILKDLGHVPSISIKAHNPEEQYLADALKVAVNENLWVMPDWVTRDDVVIIDMDSGEVTEITPG